jgi:hypothetical protein
MSGLGKWPAHDVSHKRGPNVEPRSTMPAAELAMAGRDRIEAGYIVTALRQDTGESWTLHRAGRGALAAVCKVLDDAEGDWRVLTISTPETVYRDLQGTRYVEWGDRILTPEVGMLGKIRRLDLLDPSHAPAVPRGQSHV